MIAQYLQSQIVLLSLNHLMNFSNNSIVCYDFFLLSFSFNRCYFHLANTYDDRSTLSDDDEGISSDDLDDEDISRKAIHRALKVKFFFLLPSKVLLIFHNDKHFITVVYYLCVMK